MQIQDVRALTDVQLSEELENSYRAMQNMRFRLATKQLTNTAEMRSTRKTVARLKTIMRERELVGR